jgi:hypothetical protein
MVASTKALVVIPPDYPGAGSQFGAYSSPLAPENQPAWLWGQGTPAAIPPFTTVNKGSLYSEVNASDDDPCLWVKVDEGGDTADWVLFGNTGVVEVRSALFTIDAADSEQVIFHAVTACQILEAGILYNEATETSGAATGDITIGTTTGGDELVTATSYEVAKATGYYKALTLKLSGALAAGASVFVSHDDAGSTIPGTVFIVMKIRVEA